MKIVNVTDIISYLYCPRKLYLKLVKGIPIKPNRAMILGRLKHNVFDLFNKSEPSIVSSINENLSEYQILSLYQQELNKATQEIIFQNQKIMFQFSIPSEILTTDIQKFMKREIELRVDSIKNAINSGFLGKELWRNLKPKYLTEFKIESQEIGLRGRIDRIELGDEIIPYELKTRPEIYESDKLQLAAYSLLLENEFNNKIKKGIIETHNDKQEFPLTFELKSQVLEIADKIRNLSSSEPKFQNNFNKCRNCDYKKECFNE